MSRIGNKLIPIVDGLEVKINPDNVEVKGKLGSDVVKYDPNLLKIEVEDGNIKITRLNEEKFTKQIHGTTRALLNNAVVGCMEGYKKVLEIVGIGYHADMKGNDVVLSVGYSHPITISPLEGVTIKVIETKNKEVNSAIEVSGQDKFAVGQTAALIREVRRPEPYKGKGIRYQNERILRKEGKRAGK